jgi:hypothetical protein
MGSTFCGTIFARLRSISRFRALNICSKIEFEEIQMQNLKSILIISAVLATIAAASIGSTAARPYQQLVSDYAVSDTGCATPIAPNTFLWANWFYSPVYHVYPAADWGPFFRRHVYRYGPIVCTSPIATPNVISVRY